MQSCPECVLIGMSAAGAHDEVLDDLQATVDGLPRTDADGDASRQRRAELLQQLRVQLMRGIPTPQDRATLASLRQLLADGVVEIKVFTRRALHGKAYVFHRQDVNSPIVGFVGSSNLTPPGLTHNLELNVDVLDNVAAADLAQWFEDRWDDKFSRPITAELLDLLDESWATTTPAPYDVFVKVCFTLSATSARVWRSIGGAVEIEAQLLEYQLTAVRTLARRIVGGRGRCSG